VEEAGSTVVNKQFFDTLTISPRLGSEEVARHARDKEINLRYFSSGMVGFCTFCTSSHAIILCIVQPVNLAFMRGLQHV